MDGKTASTMQASIDKQYKKGSINQPSKSELLAASYREMLSALPRHVSITGDVDVTAMVDRAEHALSL